MDVASWSVIASIMVAICTAVGALITVVVNAKKTAAEAEKLRLEAKHLSSDQKKLMASQNDVLYQFQNTGNGSLRTAVDKILNQVQETQGDIRGLRKDLGRLGDSVLMDREAAKEADERLNASICEVQQQLIDHIDAVPDKIEKVRDETLKLLEEINEAKQ